MVTNNLAHAPEEVRPREVRGIRGTRRKKRVA
jgi:hypothetical protein